MTAAIVVGAVVAGVLATIMLGALVVLVVAVCMEAENAYRA
jgi:hypothetical protein